MKLTAKQPETTHPMLGNEAQPWARALEYLKKSSATYWLATVRPDGRPHVIPVLAVWVNGGLFLCAGQGTRKAKNLSSNSHCVVTVEEGSLDLVVEGKDARVRDETTLHRVSDAYASTYDWHVTVRDGAFHDTEGAPTAGPPPYVVYEVRSLTAFGLGLDESFSPTRWVFAEASA
jgi:hypothetical protein